MNDSHTQGSKLSKEFIFFLGMLTAMAPFCMDMYFPSLPSLTGELQASAPMVQLTITTTMVGMAVGQLFFGPLSDTFGRKKPLIWGMALCAITSIICGMTSNISLLIVTRFFQGITASAGIVISKAIARDCVSGVTLTQVFALLMMVNGFAPIVAPLIGGQILIFSTWHTVFFLLALICIALTIRSITQKETLPKDKHISGGFGKTKHAFKVLCSNSYFLGNCLLGWFSFGAFFAYITESSFLFQDIYGLSAQTYSYIFGGLALVTVFVSFLAKKGANVVATNTMLWISIAISVVGSILFFIAMYFSAPLWLAILLLVITTPTVAPIGAASFSLSMRVDPSMAGSASALLGFFSQASAGLMAPFVGIAGSHNPMPMAFIMIFGYVAALVCYVLFIHPKHRGPEDLEDLKRQARA